MRESEWCWRQLRHWGRRLLRMYSMLKIWIWVGKFLKRYSQKTKLFFFSIFCFRLSNLAFFHKSFYIYVPFTWKQGLPTASHSLSRKYGPFLRCINCFKTELCFAVSIYEKSFEINRNLVLDYYIIRSNYEAVCKILSALNFNAAVTYKTRRSHANLISD